MKSIAVLFRKLRTAYSKYSSKAYLQSFSWPLTRNMTIFALLLLWLKNSFHHLLEKHIFIPFFFIDQPQHIWNLALLFLLITAIACTLPKLYNGLLPAINTWIASALILAVYLYYGRINSNYIFITFSNWNLPWLAYADVCLFSIWLFLLDFKAYNHQLRIEPSMLLEDAPVLAEKEDDYNFQGYASTIVEHISNSSTQEQSFGIGIFAHWGMGKSYFLRKLEGHFRQLHNPDNVLIHFSAWRSNSPEVLVEDFFSTLATAIKPFNSSIASQLAKYSKQLFQTADQLHLRLIDTVLSEVTGTQTILSRYQEINNTIKRTGKRFIVFIDDLDRLSGAEIVSVFKIIRSTADFANTFFISALDHDYAIESIRKTEQFSKEEQYLKKIFQLVITLPVIQSQNFEAKLRTLLDYNNMSPEDQQYLDNALRHMADIKVGPPDNEQGPLELLLDNIRDLKRFANNIKLHFDILKGEIEMGDYLLLSLLQITHFDLFHLIRTRYITDLQTPSNRQGNNFYALNMTKWNAYLAARPYIKEKQQDEILLAVANALLAQPWGQSRLSDTAYFWLYFNFQSFNVISLRDFTAAIKEDEKDMATRFSEWNKKAPVELINILDGFRAFKDEEERFKFIYAYLKMSEDDTGHFQIRALNTIMESSKLKGSKEDKQQFKNRINKLLHNDGLLEPIKAVLASNLITKATPPLDIMELIAAIFTSFQNYLSTSTPNQNNIEFFLQLLRSKDKNGNNTPAQAQTKALYLDKLYTDNKILELFLDRIFKFSSMGLLTGTMNVNPIWERIFDSKEEFSQTLDKLQPQEDYMIRLVSLVKKYIGKMDEKGIFTPDAEDTEDLKKYTRHSLRMIPPRRRRPLVPPKQ